jgi:hypothetical protein
VSFVRRCRYVVLVSCFRHQFLSVFIIWEKSFSNPQALCWLYLWVYWFHWLLFHAIHVSNVSITLSVFIGSLPYWSLFFYGEKYFGAMFLGWSLAGPWLPWTSKWVYRRNTLCISFYHLEVLFTLMNGSDRKHDSSIISFYEFVSGVFFFISLYFCTKINSPPTARFIVSIIGC